MLLYTSVTFAHNFARNFEVFRLVFTFYGDCLDGIIITLLVFDDLNALDWIFLCFFKRLTCIWARERFTNTYAGRLFSYAKHSDSHRRNHKTEHFQYENTISAERKRFIALQTHFHNSQTFYSVTLETLKYLIVYCTNGIRFWLCIATFCACASLSVSPLFNSIMLHSWLLLVWYEWKNRYSCT